MEKQSLKILSLEDSLKDYEIICELLTDEGFDFLIERVENQAGFIHSLQTQKYDVILSDFSLPGFNAFGALESTLQLSPETPFIVVSGAIGEETAIELVKKGAVDYVLKDKPERLPYAVKRSLEEAQEKNARKQAEETLAYEQYLLTMLLDNVPDYIYFKNKESQFIRINNSQSASFELNSPADAVGKSDFDFFNEEHAREAFEIEQNIMKTGKPIIGIEEKLTLLNKPESWVLTTKMPLKNKEGEIIGTFGISLDITERKQAEEALLKKLYELELFHQVTVGRELKMVELKEEINALLEEAGKGKKYLITE
jgi:PAS domain S-box-containing protein